MFLGIEIGGTKLQLGIGPGDGTLADLWRGTVEVAAGPNGIRRQITAAVQELLAKTNLSNQDLRGVGIGFGGPVDDATRTVIKSHQIEGWDNFPLADWLSELVGLPAVLGNDADCAGLAEALFGAGKGLSPIFYITIGSGIGGGLIIDGEIYRGCGRGAAEIGHLRIAHPLHKYLQQSGFGWAQGILEELASGWAIGAAPGTFPRYSGDPSFSIHAGNKASLTAQDVARAAKNGNLLACAILADAWESLADAISHVVALLCPRRLIIGGGVSLMGEEILFGPLRAKVAERVFKPFANCYDIVPAGLGEEVVVHGALALARKQLPGERRGLSPSSAPQG